MIDPATLLNRLERSLHSLNARRAKYGIDAPASLLLEIEDHEKAIALTRQLADNQLTEAQWRDALRPLLVSTLLFDDKITPNYQPPPPAQAREQRDLGILLKNVETTWIKGVLEHSLYNAVLLELGKESRADAVEHPWQRVMEIPGQERHVLPPEKAIKAIYEEANRLLLILGEPGSGKTTTLLELARDLIAEVKQDPTFSQPIPVIFNLSTWTKQQPLADWLVGELNSKYLTPKKQARRWLNERRILPLLDGLDEVKAEHRAACVEQINRLAADIGLQGVVVCCRMQEYTTLEVRLGFVGAIYLKSLTPDQVDEYLAQAGSKLVGLRLALQQDSGQRDLAKSPLMLNIMSMAYQDVSAAELKQLELNTDEARRVHMFDTYIVRMFKRKGDRYPYDPEKTKMRLAWLARNMQCHSEEVFLIESLQPSWLATHRCQVIYILISRLIGGVSIGLSFGLTFGLIGGLIGGIIVGLIRDLMVGLIIGLIIGLIVGLSFGLPSAIIDILRFEWLDKSLRDKESLVYLLIVLNVSGSGLFIGIIGGLMGGLRVGLLLGVLFGMSVGLIGGIRKSQQSFKNDIQPVETLRWTWLEALKGGGIIGLFFGISFGLSSAMTEGVIVGLSSGLIVALIFGSMGVIFSGLNREIVEMKTFPNQGIILSAKNMIFGSLIVGFIGGLIGGLSVWMGVWLKEGLRDGLIIGLSYGLIIWICGSLSGALWYGGLDVAQHYTLRLILTIQGHTPLNYARFLDYAAERIFLQKVGGGYRFIHRLLLEHFAAMEEGGLETGD